MAAVVPLSIETIRGSNALDERQQREVGAVIGANTRDFLDYFRYAITRIDFILLALEATARAKARHDDVIEIRRNAALKAENEIKSRLNAITDGIIYEEKSPADEEWPMIKYGEKKADGKAFSAAEQGAMEHTDLSLGWYYNSAFKASFRELVRDETKKLIQEHFVGGDNGLGLYQSFADMVPHRRRFSLSNAPIADFFSGDPTKRVSDGRGSGSRAADFEELPLELKALARLRSHPVLFQQAVTVLRANSAEQELDEIKLIEAGRDGITDPVEQAITTALWHQLRQRRGILNPIANVLG